MSAEYPCGNCSLEVGVEASIECAICLTWFHAACLGLPDLIIEELGHRKDPFLCTNCRPNYYNYRLALDKLEKAAEIAKQARDLDILRNEQTIQKALCPSIESLLLKQLKSFPDSPKDLIAQELMEKFTEKKDLEAVKVPGDGNCLFHSVILALKLPAECHIALRLYAAIDLISNSDLYTGMELNSQLGTIGVPMAEEVFAICKLDSWSSVWTIAALANVLHISIETVYPAVNGPEEDEVLINNRCYLPMDQSFNKKICIMWTRVKKRSNNTFWQANHFVPLIRRGDDVHDPDIPDDPNENDYLVHDRANETHEGGLSDVCSNEPEDGQMNRCNNTDSPISTHGMDCDLTALDSTSNSSQEPKESSGNQGSTPKRELTLKELWAILNDAQIESKAVSKIPLGGKSNCHFVLKLKNAGQRPFYDDAGAWNGHKSKTTKTRCVLKHGIISCPAKIDESQTKVIVTRRYYVHKQGDYRKRISSFDTVPDLYVVEYIGTAPEPLPHGNRKGTAHPYFRTDPDVIEEIRNADKMATHRHVYAELLEKNPLNGPRNSEQVRKVRSKNKIQRQLTTASNLAEEVFCPQDAEFTSICETGTFPAKSTTNHHSLY